MINKQLQWINNLCFYVHTVSHHVVKDIITYVVPTCD